MDGFSKTSGRIELSKEYLHVRGLELFGHAVISKAAEPLQMHTHSDCIEVVFVMRGEQNYYTEENCYPLVGGQGFFSGLNQPHKSGEDVQGVSEIYWLQLNLSTPDALLGYGPALSSELAARLLAIRKHVFRFDSGIASLLKRTFARLLQEGCSPTTLTGLMYLLPLLLDALDRDDRLENRLLQLDSYIDAHLDEAITAEVLSKTSGFSVSTINHRFKDYFGSTPAEYIHYKRIKRAKVLLLQSVSVTEIAMQLGYGSSEYFSTVFKKFTGASPTQWKTAQRR